MKKILILFILVSLNIFGQTSKPLNELNKYKKIWESLNITNYNLQVGYEDIYAFSPLEYGPILNFIRNGKVSKSIYYGSQWKEYKKGDLVLENTSLKITIDDIFKAAEDLIKNSKSTNYYKIKYNSKFGFPMRIEYDNPKYSDEEWTLVIYDFYRVNNFGWRQKK